MDIAQIRAEIAKLPATAQSKPILEALTEHLSELLLSKPVLVAQRESPAHPAGLCGENTCESCVAEAAHISQTGMRQARALALEDVHTALLWGGGEDLAARVSQVCEEWMKQGKPAPGPESAFIALRG